MATLRVRAAKRRGWVSESEDSEDMVIRPCDSDDERERERERREREIERCGEREKEGRGSAKRERGAETPRREGEIKIKR
jgi:hypothetical protein